jgi:hypothetical protein
MARTPHAKHLRRQRLSRLRKTHHSFTSWLNEQADRLSVPARALRDTLRNLGRRYPREVDLADNAAASGATGGYVVYCSTSVLVKGPQIATSVTNSYDDETAVAGTPYFYRIRALKTAS